MNIFQRLGAALARQIKREDAITSVNTAAVMTVASDPDWEALAGELAKTATEMKKAMQDIYRDGHTVRIQLTNSGFLNHDTVGLIITAAGRNYGYREALARYEAVQQVKP